MTERNDAEDGASTKVVSVSISAQERPPPPTRLVELENEIYELGRKIDGFAAERRSIAESAGIAISPPKEEVSDPKKKRPYPLTNFFFSSFPYVVLSREKNQILDGPSMSMRIWDVERECVRYIYFLDLLVGFFFFFSPPFRKG